MSKMYTSARQPRPSGDHALSGETMGTRWSARFFAEGLSEDTVHAALSAAVAAVDRQMSNWKTDSDLSRVNAAPVGAWIKLPAALAIVISEALRIGRDSGGAFDIAVGAAVNAWGFGPAKPDARPLPGALSGQAPAAALGSVELDESGEYVRKLAPVSLDLCGIAKGFGVDELARCLERFGVTAYLVGIDGELRAHGRKPNGAPWSVAIERPDYATRDILGVLELADQAIATSGDYRHWVEVDGAKLSHTIDPRTSTPLRNSLAAVTVLAASCMEADAWATALMVMGEQAGPEFARARGLDALFVLRDGAHLVERGVGRFVGETVG
jgi:thiamine biosynthesis lipoprotein